MSVFDADGSSAIGESSRPRYHWGLKLLKPVQSAGWRRRYIEVRLVFTKRAQSPEKQAQ